MESMRLNKALTDLRSRVDTLAKSVFLISGASITLSVNLYLNNITKLKEVVCYLKVSWVSCLISIILFVLVIGFLILQAFINTEAYRKKKLNREEITIKDHPTRCFDYLAFFSGCLGFSFFIVGMFFLILVAFSL